MSNGVLEHAVSAYTSGHYTAAHEMFLLLAQQGNAEAQYYLGLMYRSGHGVPHDDATAVYWYKKAAEQGHQKAKYYLDILFAEGLE
jgi:uncharacterized protein